MDDYLQRVRAAAMKLIRDRHMLEEDLDVVLVRARSHWDYAMGSTRAAQEQSSPFQGVWRTLEVVMPGAAPRTFRPETLVIFHGRHYSRVEVQAEQPRQPLFDPSTASADQLRAVWGPFVATG